MMKSLRMGGTLLAEKPMESFPQAGPGKGGSEASLPRLRRVQVQYRSVTSWSVLSPNSNNMNVHECESYVEMMFTQICYLYNIYIYYKYYILYIINISIH